MNKDIQIIDDSVKAEVLIYPTAELISRLFPGHPISRRGLMRSPFRDDRHPSFSCFKGTGGISRWKDQATGESGDNISLYRRVYPELDYVEAVDQLSWLLLNKSAKVDYKDVPRVIRTKAAARRVSYSRNIEPERESVLKVVSDLPLNDNNVPEELRNYWRGRGISDEVITRFCRFVVFENTNRKGLTLIDQNSGLPLVDAKGNELKDDGRNSAISLYNDIGGHVFRVPETKAHQGFKGGTSSFITTLLASGYRIWDYSRVQFYGQGDNSIQFLQYQQYNEGNGILYVNPTQGFNGVFPAAAGFAQSFLSEWVNRTLDARDVKCLCAVLNALNCPISRKAVVVEGMFDGLSDKELDRMLSRTGSDHDLVILNSIGNIRWCVPFLARHEQVIIMMDNDLTSGAGQKAYKQLCSDLASFNNATGTRSVIVNGSSQFAEFKDLNEALMARKGYPVKDAASKTVRKAVKKRNTKGVSVK